MNKFLKPAFHFFYLSALFLGIHFFSLSIAYSGQKDPNIILEALLRDSTASIISLLFLFIGIAYLLFVLIITFIKHKK